MGLLDSHSISISCPKAGCGGKINSTLGKLRKSPVIPCPRCGIGIEFKGSGLDKGLREVDKSFEGLKRSLKKLSK